MPLPTDEEILALSQKILEAFDALFGLHPGFRPAHAKGVLLQGSFTPSPNAASLSRACFTALLVKNSTNCCNREGFRFYPKPSRLLESASDRLKQPVTGALGWLAHWRL